MTIELRAQDFPYATARTGTLHGSAAVLDFGDAAAEYQALTAGAGLVPLPGRTQIEITGRDRASFLHNLCTNEVRKLAPGAGCESFFCNVHGKVLAHTLLFCTPDSIVLETVPGAAEKLLAHLERYHIREDVLLTDRSAPWSELLLAGDGAAAVLGSLGVAAPADLLQHTAAEIADVATAVRRVPWMASGCWLLSCATERLGALGDALRQAGAVPCGHAALEQARLEAGWPWCGVDITDRNLAPEVGRDAQAISYVKGCYLGQETIARIDALGHVNRVLVGVQFAGPDCPAPGAKLYAAAQEAGEVTSAAWSPKLSAPLALAYVRRGSSAVGTALDSDQGPATVVALPVGAGE